MNATVQWSTPIKIDGVIKNRQVPAIGAYYAAFVVIPGSECFDGYDRIVEGSLGKYMGDGVFIDEPGTSRESDVSDEFAEATYLVRQG